MVTVITACFNCEKTIGKAIESLLAQTDYRFEHIVIDGASKDGTLKVVEQYRTAYERRGIKLLVISEPDQGLYDALNKGIALAKGDYIGILNADDRYSTCTVEIIEKSRKAYPNTDVFMGASSTVNGNKVILKKAGNSHYITSRKFNHGAMFVRRGFYRKIGGYIVSKNFYADFEWYIRARKDNCSIRILPDDLYTFMCGGMSTGKSFHDVKERIVYRYEAYRSNHCSRLYIFECVIMELAKWAMIQ